MQPDSLAKLLIIVFLVLASIALLHFGPFDKAKWFDDGVDIVYGVIVICLSSLLLVTYRTAKNKNILTVSIGLFVIAFVRVLEIYIQEYQVSINYTPPQVLLWTVSYGITLIGAVLVAKGLWSVAK